HPRFIVRGFVDKFGAVFQRFVDLDNLTAYRSVQLGYRFYGLDTAKRFIDFQFITYFWQFDKYDIAYFILSKVGNADSYLTIFFFNPFMFFGVEQFFR